MPKLKSYSFVNIFDEFKPAGKLKLVEPFGMFEIGAEITVYSKVVGLFCNERNVLLIDQQAGNFNDDGEFMQLRDAPPSAVVALRNVSITSAVRDVGVGADDWHKHCKEVLGGDK